MKNPQEFPVYVIAFSSFVVCCALATLAFSSGTFLGIVLGIIALAVIPAVLYSTRQADRQAAQPSDE